ncbi:OLC1v1004690C2 [Oldenlandia corymbosa var. corymbosa]|nr:OLC1v1004690C2 [Oldenlandia corymbosa var. corymbosa]
MTEPLPTTTGQNPSEQNPLDDPGLFGDPDPLLENGWFIDPEAAVPSEPMAGVDPDTKAAPEATAGEASPIMATPVSQRRARRTAEDVSERPDWLPEGWKMEVKVRTSGATVGTADRYFFSPSGERFRSKVEVLHYLETGSRRKNGRKSKDDPDPASTEKPSESPAERKKKKPKATSNAKNFSDLNFDFKNPPESVTWVQSDASGDNWVPSTDDGNVPIDAKEWGTVYARLSQLDKSSDAS